MHINMTKEKQLGQFFTPIWAAEILFNTHFAHLTENDVVWEPTCGKGSFLKVIPDHIKAIGSDIDPEMVRISKDTGRPVYEGDFRTVQFPELSQVTAMIGNPPFTLKLFEEFMRRCESILPIGSKSSFIIPAYFLQTSRTTMRFTRKWSIDQEMIPRDLFEGEEVLSKPIVFASFFRQQIPVMRGFRLYAELCDVKSLKNTIQEILKQGIGKRKSVWKEVVINVMDELGGKATLEQIYVNVQGKRPTENPFWKEKIRQTIQRGPFEKIDNATYKLVA